MRAWGIAVCAAGLMLFSQPAMTAAQEAARTFAGGVMPALFPMLVLCRLLPAPAGRGTRFPWVQAAFGWMAGSPAAAQRAEALRLSGGVRPAQWERLLALTGVMSPLFFTGTLARWLQSAQTAWLMLAAHWLGAVVTALMWRAKPPCAEAGEAPSPAAASLPEAVAQAARALLAVCGSMMLFSIAAGVTRSALAALLPAWTERSKPLLAALWAVLEIGGGAKAVTEAFPQPAALLCGLCSFGGLSVWLQNLLFVGESIRPVRLLGMRALHGAISYTLCSFFLKIQNLLMT